MQARCPVCLSRNLEVFVDGDFDGVVVRCRACAHNDYVGNPFEDLRMFLDCPKNWCLVYTGGRTIRYRGA